LCENPFQCPNRRRRAAAPAPAAAGGGEKAFIDSDQTKSWFWVWVWQFMQPARIAVWSESPAWYLQTRRMPRFPETYCPALPEVPDSVGWRSATASSSADKIARRCFSGSAPVARSHWSQRCYVKRLDRR